MQKIEFQTSDDVKIVGNYYKPSSPSQKGIVLLHMMPANKESWQPLAEKLQLLGWNVLAIDLRGHGASEGGDYKNFSAQEHQKYYLDAEAALAWLKGKNPDATIAFGGASIGANETIKILANYPEIEKGFALSSGLDYYGVRAIDDASKLRAKQKLLLVGSYDDGRKLGDNCGQMAQTLFERATCHKEKIIYDTGGHGTNLFETHPELIEKLIEFLNPF